MMPTARCAVAASRPVFCVMRARSSSMMLSIRGGVPHSSGRGGKDQAATAALWRAKRRLPMTGRKRRGASMTEDGEILIGKGTKPERLLLKRANRHGLVTGATGTGKTVTLQVLAEGFSNAGVPVFAADIKGDLSGVAEPGE